MRGSGRSCFRVGARSRLRARDGDAQASQRAQDRLQVFIWIAVVELDVLDAGERVLQAERNRGRFEVNGQDVSLAFARQHHFFRHVVGADG